MEKTKRLLTLLCLFTLFIFIKPVNATITYVSDTLWSTELWTDTVYVQSNIVILGTLDISAGTKVLFENNYHIKVASSSYINAAGTSVSPIIFKPIDGNEGIGWDGIDFDESYASTSTFSFCEFHYAQATWGTNPNGGAILAMNHSNLNINNCLFKNNYADNDGGALYFENCTAEIKNCFFTQNIHGSYGNIASVNSTLDIIQNVIVNNGGQRQISAVNSGQQIVIKNNTVSNNNGHSIFIDGATLEVSHNIFNNHDQNIGLQNVSTAMFQYNFLNEAIPNGSNEVVTLMTEGNIILFDPMFEAPNGSIGNAEDGTIGNWELSTNSYCINAGIPDTVGYNFPLLDFNGNDRIYAGTYSRMDIGAYEYQADANAPQLIFNCDLNASFTNTGLLNSETGTALVTADFVTSRFWSKQAFSMPETFQNVTYSGLTPLHNNNQFTISLWIKPFKNTLNEEYVLLSEMDNGSNWKLSLQNDNIIFTYWSSDVENRVVGSSDIFSPNVWHMVTVTYDGSEIRFYKNNYDIYQETHGNFIDGYASSFNIGMHDESLSQFNGLISDVKIYDKAVSYDFISQLYQATGPYGENFDNTTSVTFEVNMNKFISNASFDPNTEWVDLVGTFNEWTGSDPLADDDGNGIYEITIPNLNQGDLIEFKFRANGNNSGIHDFPAGPNRTLMVTDQTISYYACMNDECLVNDIIVSQILSPVSDVQLSASEFIQIELLNAGSADFTGTVNIGYNLNSGGWIIESVDTALISGEKINYTFSSPEDFSTPGINFLDVVANGLGFNDFDGNDTVHSKVSNFPLYNTYPYVEDFEAANLWEIQGQNPSWEVGVPAGIIINSAYSGVNACVTNLNGSANLNEYSYIVSPLFEMTGIDMYVSFKTWRHMNENSGVKLQMMERNIGDWVDLVRVDSLPEFNHPTYYSNVLLSDVWSGYYDNWDSVTYILPPIYDTVQFRFVFASESTDPSEGFAFDDFTVSQQPGTILSIRQLKPIASPWLNATYPIEGEVINYGNNTITGIYYMTGDFTSTGGYGTMNPLTATYFNPGNFDMSITQKYTFDIYVDDTPSKATSQTINHGITKQAVFNSFPYVDSFEDALAIDSTWVSRNREYNKTGIWEITTDGSALDGTKIAGTKNGVPLPFNEESYLESPGFDMSSISNPTVSFYIKRHFSDNSNFAALLYSTSPDFWEAPYVEQTMNWPTHSNSLDDVGGVMVWSNAVDDEWVLVRAKMPNIAYQSQVQFKFVIKSGDNWQGDEGILIDKFTVEEAATDDLTFGKIVSPLNVANLGLESISIEIQNEGTLSNSGAFDVSYSVNGGAFISENISPSISPGIPFTHTFSGTEDFSTYGVYKIRFAVDYSLDAFTLNDTVEYTIVNQPLISTYPHFDDLEGGMTWFPTDGSNTWVTGTPDGTVINTASSGINAIYTNLTDNTVPNFGVIESPYFDFSTIENPAVGLKIWKDISFEQEAGAVLQYTIDSSATWLPFGDQNENWFDSYKNVMTPYNSYGNGTCWSNKSDLWIHNNNFYESYNSLGFLQQVKFRLVYAAYALDSAQNNGFAFDDIFVYDATYDGQLKLEFTNQLTTATEQLNFNINNTGVNEITSVDITISVDGQTSVTETYSGSIPNMSSVFYTTTNSFDLSAEGNHTIEAYITLTGDQNAYNDSIHFNYNKPKVISSYPYLSDFESVDDITIGGQNPSWQLGSPAGNVINYASSGTNCYMTNLTGDYNINELSWIETPVFDFSSVEIPVLEFKYWVQINEKAAFTIQASNNDGQYWENICYNDYPVDQNCSGIVTFTSGLENGIAGQYANWRTKKIRTYFGNQSNVRFRIVFNSSADATLGLDGVAIDDIRVFDGMTNDLELVKINQQNNVEMTDVAANLSFIVYNLGSSDITNFNLHYSIDGGTPVVSNQNGNVICGGCNGYIYANTKLDIIGYGEHKLKAWVEVSGDINQLNDTLEFFFTNSKGIMVDTAITFDAEGQKQWAAYPEDNAIFTSWARGIPEASSLIQSPGNNVWKTGLGSESGFREYSYIQSPGFNLSNMPFPAVEFDMWRDLGSEQVVMLQYFMDGQWHNIGSIGDANNWYTAYAAGHEDLAYGTYNNDTNMGGWTNFTDAGFIHAKHDIPELGHYPETQLRFVYFTRDNWEGKQGFAFDNFRLFNNPPQTEVAAIDLITPINGEVNATDTITILVENMGLQTIDSLFVDLIITGVDTIYEELGALNILSGEKRLIKLPQILDLSNSGIYLYELNVTCPADNDANNNYIQGDFTKLNRVIVDYSTGFQESFEGTQEWFTYEDSFNSWQLGIPSAGIINYASDGSQCWVTNLSGFCNNESSDVISQIFDLTNIRVPQISFDKWSQLNPGNGVIIQYSKDEGKSFQTIREGNNWYNDSTGIYIEDKYQYTVWSGTDETWVNVSADLPQLGNQKTVIFRIVFSNVNEADSVEGFAFDNFKITEMSGDLNAKVAYIEHDRYYCSSDTNDIIVHITNSGHVPISNFDVTLQADTVAPSVSQTITATLNPGDTIPVTFSGISFNAIDQKEAKVLKAYTELVGDEYILDNTLMTNINIFNSDWIDEPGWTTLTVCDGYYGHIFTAIDVDIYGRTWVASMYGGVTMDDGNNFKRFGEASYPNGAYSWALTAAPDGKVWWTNARGPEIWMYENGQLNKFIPFADKKFEEYIYAATNNEVWFASYSDGSVLRYNGSTFDEFPIFNGISLSSIGELPNGTIVISSYSADVFAYNGSTFEYFNIPGKPSIEEIYFDTDAGITWFGGNGALMAYDGANWYDHSTAISSENITDIDKDIYGNLWLACSSGNLIQYDGTTPIYYYSGNGLVLSDALYAVAGLNDGRIMVGSYNNGISVYANGPTANFFYTIDSTMAYFFDSSLGTNLTYKYSFGDGTVSDSINPVHVYNSQGVYEVCLTVTDDLGRSNTYCNPVQVGDTLQTYCFAQFDYIAIEDSVFFSNYSSENSTNYFWDFGDNTFSSEINPAHVYLKSGYYDVTLTVEDATNNCQASYTNTVYIEGTELACYADFYYDVSDKTVFFSNASLGTTTDYLWDFGDGQFATSADTSHTYAESGIYTVCLSVYNDSTGCLDEACLEVIVNDSTTQLCQANYSYIINDSEVSFNAQIIGSASDFFWNFGDGEYSELKNPIHMYSTPDFYQVEFTIFDSVSGCLSSKVKTIVVTQGDTNVCNATFSQFVDNGTVSFTNNSSANITDYVWDFGDGNYSFVKNPTHTYESPNYYEICLSVYDSVSGCIDEFCKVVPVTNINTVSCNANFEYYVNNTTAVFNGAAIGNITDYFWDFGDGTYGFEKNVEHTYTEPGFYYIEFVIFDEASQCTDAKSKVISIIDTVNVQCNAKFEYHTNKKTVTFNNHSEGAITQYFWDLGDGNYSTDTSLTHTYQNSGYYLVELVVYNDTIDCIDTYSDVIFVIDTSQQFCQAGFTYYTKGKKVNFTNKSKGKTTDFFWDFGDGNYSTDTNATNTYGSPGYYEVTQTIFNNVNNCLDEYSNTIVVVDTTNNICKAAFSYYPEGFNVSFTSNSVGSYKQIFWDFDDGTNSNLKNPKHTFKKPGYYNVMLSVIDTTKDCFDTKEKVIYVEGSDIQTETPVKADFKKYVVADTLTAFFTNKSLGTVKTWYWDFGDNTTASADTSPVHKYATNDYYRTCLTVSNAINQNTKCKFIPVGDVSTKNTAFFTYYADSITTTAYFKNKSLGDIVSYHWDFGDDYYSDKKNPAHAYADTGYYAVCLSTTSSIGRVRTYCVDVRIGNSIDDPCLFSCVWPGDANNDLEANHYDLLTIGLNYGMQGPRREDASLKWYGQYSQNWSNYQLDGTNNKHGDCNGDGIINFMDTNAIAQNFAYSHTYQPDVKANEWDVTMEWVAEGAKATGNHCKSRVILSRPETKGDGEIYGLGYEIEVKNDAGIVWDSIYITFNNSWLGDVTDNLLAYYEVDKAKKMIFVAAVRNDQINAVGSGTVTEVNFFLLDGYSQYDISFNITTLGGILLDGSKSNIGGSIALNLGEDKAICEGDYVDLIAPSGYASYLWSNGSKDSSITVNSKNIYWCQVIDTVGKIGTDTIIVTTNTLPELDLGADLSGGSSYELTPGSGFSSYLWNTAETTESITVTAPGIYWVEVTNEFGCSAIDSVKVSITGINENMLPEDQLSIYPNPNNGSFWIIINEGFTGNFKYQLYDMKGKLITNSESLIDGKYKEIVKLDLPQGVYYFKAQINDKYTIKKVIIQ